MTFYMLISDNFPEEPPEIVVGHLLQEGKYTPFLHLNFDHTGHVCMLSNQPGKEYYKHTSLKDLLIEL
jgi:ubiquitin-protein ligase